MNQSRNISFTKNRLTTSTQEKENVYCYSSWTENRENQHTQKTRYSTATSLEHKEEGDGSYPRGQQPLYRQKSEIYGLGSQDVLTPGETEGDLGRAVSKGSHRSGRCHAGIQSCQLSYMYMSVTHIERAAQK